MKNNNRCDKCGRKNKSQTSKIIEGKQMWLCSDCCLTKKEVHNSKPKKDLKF